MDGQRNKVLVLASQSKANAAAIDALRATCDVVEIPTIDEAIEALRRDHFSAIFSDSADFLPLERALVSQQASLVLNTIGEGVCVVDSEGRCNWMNKKMQAWPARVHEKIRRTCQGSFELFIKQVSPPHPDTPATPTFSRAKRYVLNIDDQQFMEMIASPVINPAGQVVQVVAVVWDATGTRRLQQKIDAIDRAGRELVRLESESLSKLNVGQRLKLLEEKIISYTKELMHFDHFAIRLLDRRSNKLEMVISAGFPPDALNLDLFAENEGNGISGYVAATGRSYICPDVERDPRYVMGLDQAKSSLTVPLSLHDRVIGVFNIESRQRAAFNEDDRQFAEIFGRYVAIALNILDLMVVERVRTSHTVADTVCTEAAGPLNDIASDANALIDDYIGHEDLRKKLQQILDNVGSIRKALKQAAEGPNSVLGAGEVKGAQDPVLGGSHILVADDEPNIRTTISDILRKYGAKVTTATNGAEAIALLDDHEFNLLVSDIKMPDKSGYDVFAAARKKSATVPVILMTGFGYDPNHSIVRASQEGLQAVLFKPFKVDQLLSEVRKALQQQPVQQ
ncbi:MAG: putative response regulator receiver protein [Phycisphaerales bacterium]|nr:putative response regulator receiver protein [Phycisphaerales bacterium]